MKACNDETFELDKDLLDLGLKLYCPNEMRNGVYDEHASPLPPLPGVPSNAVHNFIKQQLYIESSYIKTMSSELIYSRTM